MLETVSGSGEHYWGTSISATRTNTLGVSIDFATQRLTLPAGYVGFYVAMSWFNASGAVSFEAPTPVLTNCSLVVNGSWYSPKYHDATKSWSMSLLVLVTDLLLPATVGFSSGVIPLCDSSIIIVYPNTFGF